MNKRLLLSFALLSVCLIAVSWMIATLFHWFGSSNPTVAGAAITAPLGLIGLWYAQWQSKSRDISESHRSKKVEVYGTFFDIVEQFQNPKKAEVVLTQADAVPEEIRLQFVRLNRGLILWASPSVIKAWLNFRKHSSNKAMVLLAVDTMYQAIRKDLGNSNFGLARGDLVRITLKDPNELVT